MVTTAQFTVSCAGRSSPPPHHPGSKAATNRAAFSGYGWLSSTSQQTDIQSAEVVSAHERQGQLEDGQVPASLSIQNFTSTNSNLTMHGTPKGLW